MLKNNNLLKSPKISKDCLLILRLTWSGRRSRASLPSALRTQIRTARMMKNQYASGSVLAEECLQRRPLLWRLLQNLALKQRQRWCKAFLVDLRLMLGQTYLWLLGLLAIALPWRVCLTLRTLSQQLLQLLLRKPRRKQRPRRKRECLRRFRKHQLSSVRRFVLWFKLQFKLFVQSLAQTFGSNFQFTPLAFKTKLR